MPGLNINKRGWLGRHFLNGNTLQNPGPKVNRKGALKKSSEVQNKLSALDGLGNTKFGENAAELKQLLENYLQEANTLAESDAAESLDQSEAVEAVCDSLASSQLRDSVLDAGRRMKESLRLGKSTSAQVFRARSDAAQKLQEELETIKATVENVEVPVLPNEEDGNHQEEVANRLSPSYEILLRQLQAARKLRTDAKDLREEGHIPIKSVIGHWDRLNTAIHDARNALLAEDATQAEQKYVKALIAIVEKSVAKDEAMCSVVGIGSSERTTFAKLLAPSRQTLAEIISLISLKKDELDARYHEASQSSKGDENGLNDAGNQLELIEGANDCDGNVSPDEGGAVPSGPLDRLKNLRRNLKDAKRLLEKTDVNPLKVSEALRLDLRTLAGPGIVTSGRGPSVIRRRVARAVSKFYDGLTPGQKEDVILDYKLKTEEQLRAEIIRLRGWDLDTLNEEQKEIIDAAVEGFQTTLESHDRARLKQQGEQQILTVGGNDFVKEELLGSGAFGDVYRYKRETENGTEYLALKTMQIRDISEEGKAKARAEIEKEIRNHYHLTRMFGEEDVVPGQGNVVKMVDVVKDESGDLHVAMELLDGGDLSRNKAGVSYAIDNQILSPTAGTILSLQQLKQALEGMKFIRDQGVFHADLKPENIFMTGEGTVKIGDFGCATYTSREDGNVGAYTEGDQNYKPNSGAGDGRDSRDDLFSVGLIAEMMLKQTPSQNKSRNSEQAMSNNVVDGLIAAMTDELASQRPTIEAILDSKAFKVLASVKQDDLALLSTLSVQYGKCINNIMKERIDVLRVEFDAIGLTLDQTENDGAFGSLNTLRSVALTARRNLELDTLPLLEKLKNLKSLEHQDAQSEEELSQTARVLEGILKRSPQELAEMSIEALEQLQRERQTQIEKIDAFFQQIDARDPEKDSAKLKALQERADVLKLQMAELSAKINGAVGAAVAKLTQSLA